MQPERRKDKHRKCLLMNQNGGKSTFTVGEQDGKLAGVKIVKLQTHLLDVPTFLVTYLILLDIYVKLLN